VEGRGHTVVVSDRAAFLKVNQLCGGAYHNAIPHLGHLQQAAAHLHRVVDEAISELDDRGGCQ
jgi:hypothetical protein